MQARLHWNLRETLVVNVLKLCVFKKRQKRRNNFDIALKYATLTHNIVWIGERDLILSVRGDKTRQQDLHETET